MAERISISTKAKKDLLMLVALGNEKAPNAAGIAFKNELKKYHAGVRRHFSLEEENAIWGVVRSLFKDPNKTWSRDEVFELINNELTD